jgi:hypothetical protein
MRISDAEVLAEVEELIEDFRWARSDEKATENKTWRALKQLAGDIRSRQPVAVHDAQRALERRLEAVASARTRGPEALAGAAAGLAEELAGRWPAILQALQLLAAGTPQKTEEAKL